MTKRNWRDEYTVQVGWVGRYDMGTLPCEVVETWPDSAGSIREPHAAKSARFAKGKVNRIVWMHAEERYVWK